MKASELKNALMTQKAKSIMGMLYDKKSETIDKQCNRYMNAVDNFIKIFGDRDDLQVYSTPGRTEVGGNHTDHNAGKVLAASVNLDAIAIVSKSEDGIISFKSKGYDLINLNTANLDIVEDEKFTTAGLIRGVCAKIKSLGYDIGGFDAYCTSDVLKGSGLSSSAAFEVLTVSILNHLYCQDKITPVKNAQISQYAENIYFGKPSGLMDQTACSVGGFVTIDFKDSENPIVEKVDFDFTASSLALVITDTGGNHSNLNDEYAAISSEMKAIAKALGGNVLRDVTLEEVYENMSALCDSVNHRAVLRAIHYFNDNKRVEKEVAALRNNDIATFMETIIDSGESSWMYLQNCYVGHDAINQSVTLALAASKKLLDKKGAYRVHGGGFAGTIQAFMPSEFAEKYIKHMSKVCGKDSCYKLNIRPVGAYVFEL